MTPDWQSLLDFWFGDLEDGLAGAAQRKKWFESNPQFDQACAQFSPWLEMAHAGKLDTWRAAPHSCLAFIVLNDQLPRNIYRGEQRAYAWDDLALAAARGGIEQGFDQSLALDERAFFYMPFEHSEAILDQHLAVGLFTALRDAAPSSQRSIAGNSLRYAQQHRDIILQFGRFPHRNAALGRTSSTAEQEYVQDSDGFGQLPS